MVKLVRIKLEMKILESFGVASIVKKMVGNKLRWFRHVKRSIVDYVVRRVYQMERRKTIRKRGRPRKNIREVIKKIKNLKRNMVFDITLWRKLIHVADLT